VYAGVRGWESIRAVAIFAIEVMDDDFDLEGMQVRFRLSGTAVTGTRWKKLAQRADRASSEE